MQVILLLLALLVAQPALATTWYVAKTGSNGNSCAQAQNPATPKLTISGGAGAFNCVTFVDGAGANDIVEILDSTPVVYLENFTSIPTGTAGIPFQLKETNPGVITLRSPGNAPVFRLQGSEFHDYTVGNHSRTRTNPGLIIDGINQVNGSGGLGCIDVSGAGLANTGVIFVGIEVKNCWANGVYAGAMKGAQILQSKIHDTGRSTSGFDHGVYADTAQLTVANSEIYNVSGWCIHGYSTFDPAQPPDSNRFHDNIIRNCGTDPTRQAAGILLMGTDSQSWNNIISGVDGDGINCYPSAVACKVYGNYTFGNTGAGISTSSGSSGAQIKNNTSLNNAGGQIADGGSGTTQSNNFTAGDPRLADAPNGDYRPCTGPKAPHASCVGISALIAAGVNLGSPFNTDFAGTTRPAVAAWTIGPYEGTGAACSTTPALVARYDFEGNANDSSGSGNHGTPGTGVTFVAGFTGQAARFAGTGTISVPASASLWLCNAYTIAARIKPTSVPTTFAAVAAKVTSGSQGYYFYASSAAGYCPGSGPMAGYFQTGDAYSCFSTPFAADTWVQYVETWDGTTLRKYINLSLSTSAPGKATLDDNADPLEIGGSIFGEHFTGDMDDMKIYNCALGLSIVNPACAPAGGVPQTILAAMGSSTIVATKRGNIGVKYGAGVVRKYGFVQ